MQSPSLEKKHTGVLQKSKVEGTVEKAIYTFFEVLTGSRGFQEYEDEQWRKKMDMEEKIGGPRAWSKDDVSDERDVAEEPCIIVSTHQFEPFNYDNY